MMKFENPWYALTQGSPRWYLMPKDGNKIKWFKNRKVSQDTIDLLNGRAIKAKLSMKDWRGCFGTLEQIYDTLYARRNEAGQGKEKKSTDIDLGHRKRQDVSQVNGKV